MGLKNHDRIDQSAIVSMLFLYAGKASGILVTLFFIPIYSHTLGSAQFGIVAVILSLQALLVMLDLGMSTLVSRDVASAEVQTKGLYKLIHDAEFSLVAFYLLIFSIVVCFLALGWLHQVDTVTAILCIFLFLIMVLQNLYYSAIVASRNYATASLIQFVGNLVRASATGLALTYHEATLVTFLVTQVIFAVVHTWATRAYCKAFFLKSLTETDQAVPLSRWQDSLALIKRVRSLALFSAAGAAVTQLDKPIILFFMSSASVAPYYLAMTLCLVPMAILAGPISQYFQPILLNAMAQGDESKADQIMYRFVLTLLTATLLPSIALWFLRVPLIEFWLGASNPENILIAQYLEILLPGIAIGALGYIPYTLLLSAQDYRFQASLSTMLTIVTLAATAAAAHNQTIFGVCMIYAIYHAISTFFSWGRAVSLGRTTHLAQKSMWLSTGYFLVALLIFGFLSYLVGPPNVH